MSRNNVRGGEVMVWFDRGLGNMIVEKKGELFINIINSCWKLVSLSVAFT